MTSSPGTKGILCYGDSITLGLIPNTLERRREDNWTSVLQKKLGGEYEVIEKGQIKRCVNHSDGGRARRNGLTRFYPTIVENLVLDIVVLFLGTNDMQTDLHNTAASIANYFALYDEALKAICKDHNVAMPKVLLISPPYIDSSQLCEEGAKIFNHESEDLSKQLHTSYAEFAKEHNRAFFDAAKAVGYGVEDGVHLNKVQNKALGEELAKVISAM